MITRHMTFEGYDFFSMTLYDIVVLHMLESDSS